MAPRPSRQLLDNLAYLLCSLDPSAPEYHDRIWRNKMSDRIQDFLRTARTVEDERYSSSTEMCKLFCACCRIKEETRRYKKNLQSAHDTVTRTVTEIEVVKTYLQQCRNELRCEHWALIGLVLELDQDMEDASEQELQTMLEDFGSFTTAFEKMASIYIFLYQTFTEEVYNFMEARLELEAVWKGLDSLEECLQFLYNTAADDRVVAAEKEKQCRSRLARHDHAAEARRTRVASPTREGAHASLSAIPEHDIEPVAALRSQLEEVLSVSRPAHAAAPSVIQDLAQDQTLGQATCAQTEADDLTITEQRSDEPAIPLGLGGSGPLPSSTVSFSAVEEQVHGRARLGRDEYVTGGPDAGTLQSRRNNQLHRITRNGRSVPRIFTGSFHELELGLASLHIGTTGSSSPLDVAPRTAATEPIMIRDFATPSGTAPATPMAASVPPSPPAQTQRHYGVLSGEAMSDHRYGGRSGIPTGRFHLRSQTVADRSRSNSSQRRRENTL